MLWMYNEKSLSLLLKNSVKYQYQQQNSFCARQNKQRLSGDGNGIQTEWDSLITFVNFT